MGDALDRVIRLSPLHGAVSFPGQQKVKLPPTPADDKAIMTAHRVDDTMAHLVHAMERITLLKKTKAPDQRRYQSIHLANHMAGSLNQMHGLVRNLQTNYPAESAELGALKQTMGLAKAVGTKAKAATTAHLTETVLHHLTHAKRHADLMLQPEPAAAWEFNLGHAVNHAEGAYEHAVKLEQHLLDNYPAEAGWLRKLRQLSSEVKAAAPAAWPSGKPYARSFLTPQRAGAEPTSAPGAGTFEYGLKQEPFQTVSPSPPLPPAVPLPTPKELRAFAAQLAKMHDDNENHHLAGAQLHLESAAVKMPNNPVSALASLRSAQMAIQEEWRYRISRYRPQLAYAYSENTPPAEQSSQQQRFAEAQASIGQMRGAATTIAQFIDRVRRAYFHRAGMGNDTAGGGLAGQPNARI